MTLGLKSQRARPLAHPLSRAVPQVIAGFHSRDDTLSGREARVAGVSTYLLRTYAPPDSVAAAGFSVYVGYYERQTQGRTIHSPKNCLPGSGWEALASTVATVPTGGGESRVNRYLLKNGDARALVLYWYQGRGRLEHDEYRVKWNLLRDAAVKQRSDEALVRIVVPVTATEEDALRLATQVAAVLVPAVALALPD
jgi:EpsI family protein